MNGIYPTKVSSTQAMGGGGATEDAFTARHNGLFALGEVGTERRRLQKKQNVSMNELRKSMSKSSLSASPASALLAHNLAQVYNCLHPNRKVEMKILNRNTVQRKIWHDMRGAGI